MQSLPDAFAEQFLSSVRGLLPMAGASCYAVDGKGQPFGHRLSGLSLQQLRDYRNQYCKADPFHPALYSKWAKDVVAAEQAFAQTDPAPYMNGFLRKHGYCDEVEMFFRDREGRIALGVGIMRDERDGKFRASELDLLHRVKPILEIALQACLDRNQGLEGWRHSPSIEKLTRREKEIVALLLSGASNREIGERCGVTIATVKAHLFSIYGKTDVSSRTELVTRLLGH